MAHLYFLWLKPPDNAVGRDWYSNSSDEPLHKKVDSNQIKPL